MHFDSCVLYIAYCTLIGSGVDFDSTPTTVTFSVGEVSKRLNISVSCDEEVEIDERFEITLSLLRPNSQVVTRRSRSTGRVTDSTG